MRELTHKEQKEYDRLTLGSKQIGLEDFIDNIKPVENPEIRQKLEELSKQDNFVQLSLF